MNKKALAVNVVISIILAVIVLIVLLGIPLYQYVNESFFQGDLISSVKQKLGLEKEPQFRPKPRPEYDETTFIAARFCKNSILSKSFKEGQVIELNNTQLIVMKIDDKEKTVLLAKERELKQGRLREFTSFSDGLTFYVLDVFRTDVLYDQPINGNVASLCIGYDNRNALVS